tara:strand:- start:1 stop:141 length:141 start_codon:yes stop_codon:yes gene_type:complete
MTKVVFLGFVLILNITKKMRQIAVKQKKQRRQYHKHFDYYSSFIPD